MDQLTNLSGITWTPENGLGLTDDTPSDLKEVWKDYVAVCALKSFSIFANHIQKHPKASLYGEKGWSLYDNVKLLMPSLAKGKKAYQANGLNPGVATSTQAGGSVQGNHDVTPSTGGSAQGSAGSAGDPVAGGASVAEHGDPPISTGVPAASVTCGNVDMVSGDASEHNDVNDLAGQPPPTSPPPSPSIASKRRFSVAENTSDTVTVRSQSQPSSSHVSTSTSTSAKRGRMTGAIALTSIGHGIADLSASYRRGLELDEARHVDRLSRRDRRENTISEAVERAQQLETHLLPDVLAALIEILEENEGSAKAYLSISIESVRKAWVKRKLSKIGVTVDDTASNATVL